MGCTSQYPMPPTGNPFVSHPKSSKPVEPPPPTWQERLQDLKDHKATKPVAGFAGLLLFQACVQRIVRSRQNRVRRVKDDKGLQAAREEATSGKKLLVVLSSAGKGGVGNDAHRSLEGLCKSYPTLKGKVVALRVEAPATTPSSSSAAAAEASTSGSSQDPTPKAANGGGRMASLFKTASNLWTTLVDPDAAPLSPAAFDFNAACDLARRSDSNAPILVALHKNRVMASLSMPVSRRTLVEFLQKQLQQVQLATGSLEYPEVNPKSGPKTPHRPMSRAYDRGRLEPNAGRG